MALAPYKLVLETYTQLEISSILNSIINLSLKTIRTILSISILLPYCNEIGQITQGILAFIIYLVIRFKYCKVKNGTLVKKY